jgi:hypothetical protein
MDRQDETNNHENPLLRYSVTPVNPVNPLIMFQIDFLRLFCLVLFFIKEYKKGKKPLTNAFDCVNVKKEVKIC